MQTRQNLAIMARGITSGFSGPNEFIQGLIQGFLDFYPSFNMHVYYDSPTAMGLFPQTIEHVLPSNNRLIWDQLLLPVALRRDKIDIAIFPKGTIPFLVPCTSIAVVHDLGYFYPELKAYKVWDTYYMKFGLQHAVKRARGVFAVSEFTRQDVIRLLKANPEQVITIHEAPREVYKPVVDIQRLDAIRNKYGLHEPFVFYPTSISPRKNISRVLDAFEKIRDTVPHHLYLTGGAKWNMGDIMTRTQGEMADRVHLLGAVPSADMPVIYSLAQFSIYPSLFEGFGLPVLEAFLCGSPVMISNLTSLPEVAGDAALRVDGYDVKDIQRGLLRMATDGALRESLRTKGFERSKLFHWEQVMSTIRSWMEATLMDN